MRNGDRILARILGVCSLLVAAWHMLFWYGGRHSSSVGYRTVAQSTWKIDVYFALFGLCLLVYRRWSRIVLLVLGAFSLVFGVERVHAGPVSGQPYGFTLDLIVFFMCSLPLIIAVAFWRSSNS